MITVISGGTKGIGRAIAEAFAQNQSDLVLCARDLDDLKKTKQTLEKQFSSVTVHIYKADLSQKADVLGFAHFIKSLEQPIDVLVNNAGSYKPGAILNEEEGNLEFMINTNLYSAYHLTRAVFPLLRKEGGKSYIFNMCSIASLTAYANGGSYSISKFALLGFTKNLREELKSEQIRVSAIMPGATMSASWAGSGISEDRIMQAKDVATAVWAAYSMSPQAVVEDIVLRPQLGDL